MLLPLLFYWRPESGRYEPIRSYYLKDSLSGLRQLLTTENLLKLVKSHFYLMLIALFALKIFTFLSRHFVFCLDG